MSTVPLEVRDEADETVAVFEVTFSDEPNTPPSYDFALSTPGGSAYANVAKDAALVILRIPGAVKAGKVEKKKEETLDLGEEKTEKSKK